MFEFIIGATLVGAILLILDNVRTARLRRQARQEIGETLARIEEKMKLIKMLRLEKENDVMYAYEIGKDEFVAQGTTLRELDAHFKQRFPGMRAVVVEGQEFIAEEFEQEIKNV